MTAGEVVPVFRVEDERGNVVLQTDDWTEAERAALVRTTRTDRFPWWDSYSSRAQHLRVRGTHPTHQWDNQRPRRCTGCGAWDNGSYGSHSPCGFDWSKESLIGALDRLATGRKEQDCTATQPLPAYVAMIRIGASPLPGFGA